MSYELIGEVTPITITAATDDDKIRAVLGQLSGVGIESDLIELAAIGGADWEPSELLARRFATNRLALSENDRKARDEYVAPAMERAGMTVFDHPLATIGTYEGTDPDLAPIVILSHTDTVPNGDMYDGVLGVVAGIRFVRALHAANIRLPRSIIVASLTGEESASFNSALFGSDALFNGLTERVLASESNDGVSIRQALGETAAAQVTKPVFGPKGDVFPTPHAVIELHVEQAAMLESLGVDLGIVHAIAAPERFAASIGDTKLQPDTHEYAHERYLELEVEGHADHSGATPMGMEYRADGLVETARLLQKLDEHPDMTGLTIGSFGVLGGAMNVVPGRTTAQLRLTGESLAEIDAMEQHLKAMIAERNLRLPRLARQFNADPWTMRTTTKAEAGNFFTAPEMRDRQKTAFETIQAVNEVATSHATGLVNVVGTVGVCQTDTDGIIGLKIDLRGLELSSRTAMVDDVRRRSFKRALASLAFGEPISSGAPTTLDSRLVDKAIETIDDFAIGSSRVMHSAAGHDAQNAARVGIPTVMLFCPAKGGVAHNPEAYTYPQFLEKGVKGLTALAMRLAYEV